uniref:Transmembrane protein 222 n=1 Tax=Leptobrachium leishanense TaxID=445787 RepID=A0A8C5LTC9_9ANUR
MVSPRTAILVRSIYYLQVMGVVEFVGEFPHFFSPGLDPCISHISRPESMAFNLSVGGKTGYPTSSSHSFPFLPPGQLQRPGDLGPPSLQPASSQVGEEKEPNAAGDWERGPKMAASQPHTPARKRRRYLSPSHIQTPEQNQKGYRCLREAIAQRWLFPFIGHMGICTSSGVIRDFAGPYYVSEDSMAFGRPVKYWQLDPNLVHASGPNPWDTAVHEASEEYKHRMHNLCCDNCHSHVAMALNLMKYNNTSWNMVKLCFLCLLYGRFVSFGAFLKTWLPFLLMVGAILTIILTLHLR